ncbi:MAG TPA: hypothetical protein VJ890_01355 [Vineibacter sp.]|nr:hypothetical protein [Vineibacter sp.]
MSFFDRPEFLRTVLLVDAVTCVATGALMTLGAGLVSGLTQIPTGLLTSAGLSLFPIAAFIAFVATRQPPPRLGVWLVIAGNVGWVLGSILLMLGGFVTPNSLGYAFITGQAIAVAILAELEVTGVRRMPLAV